MIRAKRYQPLLMLFDLWGLVKSTFFVFIFLFVIKADYKSSFVLYGRYVFLIFLGVSVLYILVKWLTHKYELDEQSFHLYQGVISKTERTIPFSKIQNINRHRGLFHRLFDVTSISFETGMSGDEAAVTFKVISNSEANLMEEHLARSTGNDEPTLPFQDNEAEELDSNRTIHFRPTKKDTLKASFTSLSFIFLIPVLFSFYSKLDDIFHVEREAKGIFSYIISSWWLVTTIVIVLMIASIAFGMVRTFLKYGKYEISSDSDRIYITKGVIDETAFSIAKDRVQAIEIHQSLMKRLLGLAEVKLTSAGSFSLGEEKLEVNSLYPFLPIQQVYEMITEILPAYEVTSQMKRLPKKSFWVRMFSPSWIWILATAALFYFKPVVLEVEQSWWILTAVLLLFISVIRWLDFMQTRYILNDKFIQLKTGGLTTSLFVSKRDKVIEIQVTRNLFQKWLGLASIETINRAKPVKHNEIEDVPVEFAEAFYQWYQGRRREVEVE
ncbi:PH domain-containing protein [Neobacillus sp. K501]